MKTLILSMLFIVALCQGVYAEATEDDSNNSTSALCPGDWTLIKPTGWCVKNEYNTIIPLTASTIILGCDKAPTELSDSLIGATVDIKCAAPYVNGGLPDITSILIICK